MTMIEREKQSWNTASLFFALAVAVLLSGLIGCRTPSELTHEAPTNRALPAPAGLCAATQGCEGGAS